MPPAQVRKYRQINHMVAALGPTLRELAETFPCVHILDAACGRSSGRTGELGGIRAISQEQLARARDTMRRIVAENLPHTQATIEFNEGYPPMSPTEGNMALAKELSAINVALGREAMPPLDPSRRGAADISFVAPYTDALAGLGGIGGGGHTPDEYVQLSSLPLAIKRAAILIYRLSRDDNDG